MAYFGHRRGDCSVCGATEWCVETDLFGRDGLLPSPGDADLFCFGCYLDILDSRGAGGYGHVCTLEPLEGEYLVGAARRRGDLDRVADRVEEVLGLQTARHSAESLFGDVLAGKGEGVFGAGYLREIARGVGSVRRGIYTSVSGSGEYGYPVLDFASYMSGEVKSSLVRKAAEEVAGCPGYGRVRKRADVECLVLEELPLLGPHSFGDCVEGMVWRWLKNRDREVLGSRSRTAMRNQRRGRAFEEFFEDLCDRRGIRYYRDTAGEFRRRHPSAHGELESKYPGLSGVPDYLVVGDGGLGDGWRPGGTGFVEVKYRGSRLSGRQKRVVAHLRSQGFPVWVLRGSPEDYYFDRR